VIDLVAAAGPLEMPSLLRGIENTDVAPVGHQLIEALRKSSGLASLPIDRLVTLVKKLPPNMKSESDALLKQTNVDLEGQKKRLEELKDALAGGDPERGRALFFGTKASCSACHSVGEQGGHIGPNLAGIGDIRARRDLLEAVVFPSASFARNFEPYTVQTTAGKVYDGLISRRTSDAIYITTSERKEIQIKKSDIDEEFGIKPSKVSIMPQGLDRLLTPSELQDVLAFLSSLKGDKAQ
jgi:putative heme-binding domain-containing protein